ncbi:CidA/LrgA family protein [uncultured Alteromonas sp.]|jgi:holin-like protein|uniref:CidA/LrgA family protein n=1 Tax=uncultured Alteromonas sp. TaxID=179113 RepID=UPI000C0D5D28|nr:CidA/LrgA family protein [uncultured Alteromonas sp.]PHS56683.1 MAG: murein hydrolase transporter LrgA [Alteromonas sp.]|tara:strand:+ start:3423 stop:3881 length:459 start_codon:yes stop_codon:yes gene_type:complete
MVELRQWITGAILVLGCYYLGTWLSSSTGLPLPGALTGLLILLAVLFIAPKAEPLVARAASPLLSHMSVLFVPAVLGVSAYWKEIAENGWAIGIAIIITTCISLGISAKIAEKLLSSRHTHLSQVPAKRDTAEQVTEQKVVKKMVRKGSDND